VRRRSSRRRTARRPRSRSPRRRRRRRAGCGLRPSARRRRGSLRGRRRRPPSAGSRRRAAPSSPCRATSTPCSAPCRPRSGSGRADGRAGPRRRGSSGRFQLGSSYLAYVQDDDDGRHPLLYSAKGQPRACGALVLQGPWRQNAVLEFLAHLGLSFRHGTNYRLEIQSSRTNRGLGSLFAWRSKNCRTAKGYCLFTYGS
jgi:hypothetical protein